MAKRSSKEYLSEQVDFTFNDKQEIKVARYIIGLLDTAGYLRVSTAEISSLLKINEKIIEKLKEILRNISNEYRIPENTEVGKRTADTRP